MVHCLKVPKKKIIIVPCYNEALRLRWENFSFLTERHDTSLFFVNDGSTDDTARILQEFTECFSQSCKVLALPRNVGKAETVRQGMLRALSEGASVVGYFDADAATPAEEMSRLLDILENENLDVVTGARIALLGNEIRRHALRHYIGRIFATMASITLDLPIYDTQCGAKCFRVTPTLVAALQKPFVAGWAFDVELLSRLLPPKKNTDAPSPRPPVIAWKEVPLLKWEDKSGSKVSFLSAFQMGWALVRLFWKV